MRIVHKVKEDADWRKVYVWGIDAAVLFHPSNGQALLAFVLERKRAVGVLKIQSTKSM
jgi:hypothetical protein